MPPIDAQPPIDIGGTTGDSQGSIGEIAGIDDLADSINPLSGIGDSISGISGAISGLTGGPVDQGSDVLDTRAQQNVSGGGSKVIIAPTHLNLGEILQNFSGPPENGGYGVNSPAAGFFTNPTRLNANASNVVKSSESGMGPMMPVYIIGGGLALVGVVILLKRRR